MIKTTGLNANEFHWTTAESRRERNTIISILEHTSSYYFRFDYSEGTDWSEFSPGRNARVEYGYPGSWGLRTINVREWLIFLKDEIKAPDLWASISQELQASNLSDQFDDENRAFTSDEKQKLQVKLEQIRIYLIESKTLSTEQTQHLQKQIDYLVEQAESQNIREWKNLAIGVLIQLVVSCTLPPERINGLFKMLTSGLGQIIVRVLHN